MITQKNFFYNDTRLSQIMKEFKTSFCLNEEITSQIL